MSEFANSNDPAWSLSTLKRAIRVSRFDTVPRRHGFRRRTGDGGDPGTNRKWAGAGRALLDHSMIVYGSSLSDGHAHGSKDLPLLLAGGNARQVTTGRVIGNDGDTSMSDLHLALLHRLGVRCNEFAESKSPLTLT